MKFNHLDIEKKWQKYWEDNQVFKTDLYDFSKPKFYALDMFPYPSGHGLHVGHPKGYTASDIVARFKRMQGYNVLHPMGFDAFGLPAEQYAVLTGNHPDGFTQENIITFTKQLKMLGFCFDWSKQISTCDPSYYKWTQWIFLNLFKDGLAKQTMMQVNWCEELQTVLANDEVINGKSERGGFPVIKKDMKEWTIDIPKYAEKLLDGLNDIEFPLSTKEMQRNWIGKSEGAIITFKVADSNLEFDVFTTRCDTIYGVTYCVLAPENELVLQITGKDQLKQVNDYIIKAKNKSEIERLDKSEKEGVFTGSYAINPISGKKVPIWISDYVLNGYGTGAVMAVPAHDERDYVFANKYKLDIEYIIECDSKDNAYTLDGNHINSKLINGKNISDSKRIIIDYLEKNKIGSGKINYKLREWVFARQRYWGEPIPVVHFKDGPKAIDYSELPLVLPTLKDYKTKKGGHAPLENAVDWIKYKSDKEEGIRETSTMPGSAGSSWYFLRYLDPHNENQIADPKLMKHWLPVDLYIGGSEHAVGHLLYSRFFTNYLYDKGIVPVKEPFKKLVHQGMILGENGEKMSKSKGNVINPDDVIQKYGADTLRLYEMFMGPLEAALPWSDNGLEGARKFLDRVYRLFADESNKSKIKSTNNGSLDKVYNFTVKKVTNDYETLNFNTAISQLMIFVNELYKAEEIYNVYLESLIKMLNPIAPHLTEQLWFDFTNKNGISYEPWPTYDEKFLIESNVELIIQVNGKLRDKLIVNINEDEEVVKQKAAKLDKVMEFTKNSDIVKIIYVKNKIVNIVIK
ncbi:MAG: leucine--tRNA ligase [Anaeroplasmataceae bacterium]